MRTVCIIQARMESTRFPGKVMADICGKPMIQRVVDRVWQAESVNEVIVAVPNSEESQSISGINIGPVIAITGDINDVLKRYIEIADLIKPDNIVRITGDCPLICPDLIDDCVEHMVAYGADYWTNRPSYPDGLDVEVFTYEALCRLKEVELSPEDREHVTPYFINHKDIFKTGMDISGCAQGARDHSMLHWSVDLPKDLSWPRYVYEKTGGMFNMETLLDIWEKESKPCAG